MYGGKKKKGCFVVNFKKIYRSRTLHNSRSEKWLAADVVSQNLLFGEVLVLRVIMVYIFPYIFLVLKCISYVTTYLHNVLYYGSQLIRKRMFSFGHFENMFFRILIHSCNPYHMFLFTSR